MKELIFGKYKINVEDLSHDRIEKAKGKWERAFYDDNKSRKKSHYNKKANKIGSYLINQDFFILKRTLSFTDACKEWFKRTIILNSWYLNKSLKKEYDVFHDFVTVTITGLTIGDLKKNSKIEKLGREMYRELEEMGYTDEQCLELFRTFAQEWAGR